MTSHDERELELLLASRFPIISIETHEETRALALLERCAAKRRLAVHRWAVTTGLQSAEQAQTIAGTQDPAVALRQVASNAVPAVFVWLDFHPFLENPVHIRLLKEIASNYERVPHTLVLMSHHPVIPAEIEKLCARFTLSLPDKDAVLAIVKSEVAAWQKRHDGKELKGEREVFELMIRHLSGLPEVDVRRLVRQAFQDDGLLNKDDLPRLIQQKHTLLARDSVLSFEIETAKFMDVAGLKNLKTWLERRRSAFLGEPQASKLDTPKGIMLLGVQGCGKSLAAKAVAGAWGVPLMRLDFGALYNKFLGETERNLREALKAADAMSPCVLWIDELEKGISGNNNSSDGGESRRVLGGLLTWMAERNSRVFIVATSNDIEALPPELVRKGRLDEIFFVDLPSKTAREEILRIHLIRRQLDPSQFDLAQLSVQSDGFSGAEIEQAVIAALYECSATQSLTTTAHIASELTRTRPLSVVMAEKIAYLRAWARDRTVSADE
jgi:AAA+ superfamily predicted ATPase